NGDGQLGNGTTTNSATPAPVGGQLTYASVSAGSSHACGVTTSGGASYCWGSNAFGQLGNGTTTNSPTPVVVAGGLAFATLTAGLSHTCGITTTGGTAYCWGDNYWGELGN